MGEASIIYAHIFVLATLNVNKKCINIPFFTCSSCFSTEWHHHFSHTDQLVYYGEYADYRSALRFPGSRH